jgi:hypothetical protein
MRRNSFSRIQFAPWIQWLLGGIAIGIGASCNLYRNAFDSEPTTATDFLQEGQRNLRENQYELAQKNFDKALEMDSTLSRAYVGAAKSVLMSERINVFSLIKSLENADGGSIPFLDQPDSLKNKIFQGNRGINFYLGRLIRADKDGRLDGQVTSADVAADYALASAIEAILSLADFNGDGRIDEEDNLLNGVIDFSDPSNLNPETIMKNLADVQNDTAKINAVNQLLDKTELLLAQSGSAIDLLLGTFQQNGDSLVTQCPDPESCQGIEGRETIGDSSVTQVKQFIEQAGSQVILYKIMDRKDNDGDGCVDEELLDGIDNDGDGYVDEDSRGAPDAEGNSRYNTATDGTDNDGDGEIDEADEAVFMDRYEASLEAMELLANPVKRGEIFWSGVSREGDTRRRVPLTNKPGTQANPGISTFDLCQGEVKGF